MKADVTGLSNSNLRVTAAKEVLLELVRSRYLNISLSNNPALSRGGHFVKVEPLEVICRQSDADRSKECHHRRHSFFTENRDLNVVITANRLVF